MHQTKLFKIIESFDPDDRKKSSRYLLSRISDTSDTYQLFNYFHKNRYRLHSKYLGIEITHERLQPRSSKKNFQNTMSKLTKLIEDYIRIDWAMEQEGINDLLLFKALNSRGLYHFYDLKKNSIQKKYGSAEKDSVWTDQYLLQIYHDQFFSNNPIKSKNGEELLIEMSDQLVKFTSNLSLLYQGVLAYFGRIRNSDLSDTISQLEPLVQVRNQEKLNEILHHFVLLNQYRLPQSFDFLYNKLVKTSCTLSHEIQSAILTSLIHYAYEEYRSGSSDTADALLSLNEYGISSGLLLINNKMSATRFVNIVNVACACNKFSWAYQFIEDNNHLLYQQTKDETIHISKAQIHFHASEYEQVIGILISANYQNFMNNLRMRWLLLCSYFIHNRDDIDFLDAVIRNYNSFIKNNKSKISEANYKGSLNLSRILKNQLKEPSEELLKTDLEEMNEVVFRSWVSQLFENKKRPV